MQHVRKVHLCPFRRGDYRQVLAQCDDRKCLPAKPSWAVWRFSTVTCRTMTRVRNEYTAAVTGDRELPSDSGTSNKAFFS